MAVGAGVWAHGGVAVARSGLTWSLRSAPCRDCYRLGDLGGEQVGGGALELGHAGQVAVAVDVATEPARGGECQVRDAVRAGEPDQVGST